MSSSAPDLLAIGRIEKAFGLKGEVVVQPMTDSPDRFRRAATVYIGRTAGSTRQLSIESVSIEPRGVRAKISGVDSRTAAEEIVGSLMFVDAAGRVRPEKGRHFVHELIGLAVIDQDGRRIGVIENVLKLPAQDVYVVNHDGREVLLPAVKEFVTSVDIEAGAITVKLIEGMLDEQ